MRLNTKVLHMQPFKTQPLVLYLLLKLLCGNLWLIRVRMVIQAQSVIQAHKEQRVLQARLALKDLKATLALKAR
jgi:hypothetical protein|tara:strand:+ start:5 stop:226 length:222 start_codon:yes stop_codon:yes gene_type:complete